MQHSQAGDGRLCDHMAGQRPQQQQDQQPHGCRSVSRGLKTSTLGLQVEKGGASPNIQTCLQTDKSDDFAIGPKIKTPTRRAQNPKRNDAKVRDQ